jgi:hypothetical protein
MFALALDARREAVEIIAALSVPNTVGYFIGGWFEAAIPALREPFALGLTPATLLTLGRLMRGVCYGIGIGAGLGLAFHICQTRARALMTDSAPK